MINQTSGQEASVRVTKSLIAGLLLVAAMVFASVTAAASQAHASTTFAVNETGDAKDASTTASACDTDGSTTGKQCTLRAAIEQANATAGADAINFNIPGTGVKTISPGSPLPEITDQVTIDGYTQTGATPNTKAVGNDAALKVVLNGTNAGSGAIGLDIVGAGASNSVIKGLVINRFGSSGINVFSSSLAGSTGVRIQGNFIGTDVTGTLDRGNDNGVSVFSSDISGTVIGGTTPAERNLVSGANDGNGLDMGDTDTFFGGQPSSAIRVQGNYIGTDRSGTKDLGNDLDGIFLEQASGAIIGGKTAASRNVVSANGGGVDLVFVSGSRVLGNRIGTTASGTGALGNDEYGIFLDGSSVATSENAIGDGTAAGSNTVAFTGGDGIEVDDGFGNEISRNSVFSNAGLGIDLRGPGEDFSTSLPTKNDPGDTDDGPNDLQNKPVLTSAKTVSGKTTIAGKLESTAGQTFTVEFYANPADTSEGKTFLGEKTITTTVDGIRSFTFSPATAVKTGQAITATATNDSTHDTSEFSAPRTVTSV